LNAAVLHRVYPGTHPGYGPALPWCTASGVAHRQASVLNTEYARVSVRHKPWREASGYRTREKERSRRRRAQAVAREAAGLPAAQAPWPFT